MPTSDILTVYEEIMNVSHQMLRAAQSKDWDSLTMLELMCEGYIQQIQTFDRQVKLSESEVDKKMHYLKQILADDKQIRLLLEPWMGTVMTLMRSGARHE
jgi:flagellar protein FliT